MTSAGRIAFLVIACALLAGAIYGAMIGQVAASLMFLALAALCGAFERLLAVRSQDER